MRKNFTTASKDVVSEFYEQTKYFFEQSDMISQGIIENYMTMKKVREEIFCTWPEYKKRNFRKRAFEYYLRKIVVVEIIILTFFRAFEGKGQPTVKNVWSYLPNYKFLLPKPHRLESLEEMDVIRVYFSNFMTQPTWEDEIIEYQSKPKVLRLYNMVSNKNEDEDEEILIEMNPKYFENRKNNYEKLLLKECIAHEKKILDTFVEPEESVYFYKQDITGRLNKNDKEQFKINIVHQKGKQPKKGFPKFLVPKKEELAGDLMKIKLPSGRKKIRRDQLHLPLDFKNGHWTNNSIPLIEEHYKSMSIVNGRDFRKAQEDFNLHSMNSIGSEFFRYDDKVGIAAGVGIGKSTLMLLEIVRLTNLWKFQKDLPKGKGAKVGVWTVNVTEALMLVYRLHQIGVKAVPIIGNANAKKHLKNFVKQVKHENAGNHTTNPLAQLAQEYVLQFFKGTCSIESYTGIEEMRKKPCMSLKVAYKPHINENSELDSDTSSLLDAYEEQNKEMVRKKECNCSCPLFNNCGMYLTERLLSESTVWIGTEEAFFYSKPMPLANPYDMTYAEIAHFELDVIFNDEADSLQANSDSLLLSENYLLGSEDTLFEKNFLSVGHNLDVQYPLAGVPIHGSWRFHTKKASDFSHLMHEILKNNLFVRKKVHNKTFGIHQICKQLTESLFEVPHTMLTKNHPFFDLFVTLDMKKTLNRTLRDEKGFIIEREIRNFFNDLEEIKTLDDNPREITQMENEALYSFFEKVVVHLKHMNNHVESRQLTDLKLKKQLMKYFYFMLTLIMFDFHFKMLITKKSSMELLLNTNIEDINSYYRHTKRYLPFLPSSPTGKHFQYYFREKRKGETGNHIGVLQTYDYLGVGRDFLTNFSSLYEHVSTVTYEDRVPVTDKYQEEYSARYSKGPAMVFMSATMYAEKSLHFHLDVPLSYLMTSVNPSSKVEQFLYPVYEDEDARDNDGLMLPIRVSGIKDKEQALTKMAVELELLIREELEFWNKRGENRKVILVVNSYEQTDWVLKALRPIFKEKVVALTNDPKKGDENHVVLGEIERIAKREIDILITPLLSINRGYNILKYNQGTRKYQSESYFGSIFFMVRPLIPSDSIDNIIKILNGIYKKQERYMKQSVEDNNPFYMFYNGIKEIRTKTNAQMYHLLSVEENWSQLEEQGDRNVISWFMLINIIQMIGRLQRGQTDVRVYYLDAAFAKQHAIHSFEEDTIQDSMIKIWEELLSANWINEQAKDSLYGYFLDGLRKINKRWKEEETCQTNTLFTLF
ncbi:hypothetical protein [Bacillus cereus]